MTARRIALLGAPGTGKTTLARELAAHLHERGLRALVVAPLPAEAPCDDPLAPAQAHEARVDAAACDAELVIVDAGALQLAVDAQEDAAMLRLALERQRACDATLVTGLDLPVAEQGTQRGPALSREAFDARLRALLARAGIAYQVVYGQGPRRLQAALVALHSAGVLPAGPVQEKTGGAARDWVWSCDKCSDPACEHRLFTRLQGARG